MSRKLVILDLNGTLLLRSKGNRKVWARPYFQCFLSYLFHPSVSTPKHESPSGSKGGLDVMIWSSAQPHSVGFMVERIFGPNHVKSLVAVWDRTCFGLTQRQYNAKHPTVKDLASVWKAFPRHSCKDTVLLDDSVNKAQRQPDNHICLVEYTSKVRAQDLEQHRDGVVSVASSADPVSSEVKVLDPKFDSFLLAIVGVLDVMREKDDVAAWIHNGGLRTKCKSKDSTSEDDLATLLSKVNLDDQGSAPDSTGLWFEDVEVLEYWINQGKATLEALQIPIHAEIAL